jgi:hypothetical protein
LLLLFNFFSINRPRALSNLNIVYMSWNGNSEAIAANRHQAMACGKPTNLRTTLCQVEHPDEVVVHSLHACPGC